MSQKAIIYRTVSPEHLCPWGIKAKDLLKRSGYIVEDRQLKTEKAKEVYKQKNNVTKTPQIYISGEHIGGYNALRDYLGKGPDPKEGKTYQPVLVVFAVTLLMALATTWAIEDSLLPTRVVELFVAFSMCVLGILKLQDLLAFATGFVQYDLIARRYVPYAYLYAFVETGGGVLMIAGIAIWIVAPAVLTVSTIGAISVFKAVYIDQRDLNCACVGGGSNVPLGFISLTENLMMMTMAIWMIVKQL